MPGLPSFFVLGAARCGTTSLTRLLAQHPDIFVSDPREPFFFTQPYQVIANPVAYARLFERAEEHQVIGEASHAYMTDPASAATLRAFLPSPKFIVVLRNPADRAYALYAHMRSRGYEHISSFERALAAEDRRFRSRRFQARSPHYLWNYMYFRSGLFGEQMARYLALFPAESFYVTTLYRLVAQYESVAADIHRFLGVAEMPPPELPHLGQSRGVRLGFVQNLERRLVRPLTRRGIRGSWMIRRAVTAWNRTSLPPIPAAVKDRLMERYRPDLVTLADLTGCDLVGDEERYRAEPTTPTRSPPRSGGG
jgi:hypothetical protein